MMEEGVRLHPFYKLLQSEYPERLAEAELAGSTICLPDPRNTREVPLSDDFVSAHILTEEEGGYFSSSDGVVSVESCQGSSGWPDTLKLLEGPGYQPSYARWHQLSRVYFVILSGVSTAPQSRRLCRDSRLIARCSSSTGLCFLSTAEWAPSAAGQHVAKTPLHDQPLLVDHVDVDLLVKVELTRRRRCLLCASPGSLLSSIRNPPGRLLVLLT